MKFYLLKVDKINNKYVIFPTIMTVITIIATFTGYAIFDSIFELLDIYDITGVTKVFMLVMFTIEIIFLAICIFKGIKSREGGFDYSFSKFAFAMFLILVIIPIFAYFMIGSAEKKLADELETTRKELISFSDSKYKTQNKKSELEKLQEYLNIDNQDKFYDRKMQIIEEYNRRVGLEKFVHDFVLNFYNISMKFKSRHIDKVDRYYAIYSRVSVVNIICCAFYFISATRDNSLVIKRFNWWEKYIGKGN